MRSALPRNRVLSRIISSIFIVACFLSGIYVLLLAFTPSLTELPIVREPMRQKVVKALEKGPATNNRLYIPKLGVDIEVLTGNENALLEGAWNRKPENGNPHEGGNYVLSAHRFDMGWSPEGTLKKSPFYHIDELKPGDVMTVDYEQKRYEYIVERIYEVKPNAINIENRTPDPTLTLYSCTLRGSADGRNVVEAKPL